MNSWSVRVGLILVCLLAFTYPSPAPLVYRPGEGWTYEAPGETGGWQRTRAKDQLDVAQEAFDEGNYTLALKAARRTVRRWPMSDYAPQAQYLVGRCYEAKGQDEKAFKAYQQVIERYPRIDNYQDIVERQFEIANRFLAGQWFKLWGYIPFFPSMDKTVDMYDKVLKNGPYSEIASQAQMNIGAAREKQSDYPQAAQAYDRAADRYNDQREVAADARFKAGMAYQKQAKTAEYDQSVAAQAIDSFIDFAELYPNDERVPEAREIINTLRAEQARGSFQIARFYEKRKRFQGALIYYNEVLIKDPDSNLADDARNRIDLLQRRLAQR
jgi:outer membrane protein assembly factor BamD